MLSLDAEKHENENHIILLWRLDHHLVNKDNC